MSTETSSHFGRLLQIKKKISLKSDFIHIFYDFIHVHSPGAGGRKPLDENILMSTETACHFGRLLQILETSL